MSALREKISHAAEAKESIRTALVEQGVPTTTSVKLSAYPAEIGKIEMGSDEILWNCATSGTYYEATGATYDILIPNKINGHNVRTLDLRGTKGSAGSGLGHWTILRYVRDFTLSDSVQQLLLPGSLTTADCSAVARDIDLRNLEFENGVLMVNNVFRNFRSIKWDGTTVLPRNANWNLADYPGTDAVLNFPCLRTLAIGTGNVFNKANSNGLTLKLPRIEQITTANISYGFVKFTGIEFGSALTSIDANTKSQLTTLGAGVISIPAGDSITKQTLDANSVPYTQRSAE